MKNLPNVKTVLFLSFGFFFLFFAFGASSNIASQAMKNCGFHNLGFYSLAVLYAFFSLSSLGASSIVYKLQHKKAFIFSGLALSLWILTLSLTTVFDRSEVDATDSFSVIVESSFSKEFIYSIVIIASALCGVASSVLWVAQGKCLSDCAKVCPEKKGLYTSIFWTTMLSS